jgi:hypothetical protein
MVQGAVDGSIDFTKAVLRDPKWHIGLCWRLRALDRQNKLKMLHYTFQKQIANMTCPHIAREAIGGIMDQTTNTLEDILDTIFQGDKPERSDRRDADQLKQSWENVFGKLSDPVVASAIQRTTELLDALNAK